MFVRWAEYLNLDYIKKPSISTYYTKYIINLTFFNIPFAKSIIYHNLNNQSDHFIIIIIIPKIKIADSQWTENRVKNYQLKCFAKLIKQNVETLPELANLQNIIRLN